MYVCAFLETWEKLLFIDLFHFLTDLYPPVEEIVGQCGKFRLLERLLVRLFAKNHKVCSTNSWLVAHFPLQLLWPISFADDQVLIFSQWTKLLDIMDYYFSEKGFEVCRIDGSVKLDERRRQVFSYAYSAFSLLLSNILTRYYKYKVSLSSLPWNRSKTSVMRRAAVEYFSSVPELGDSESILLLLIHASSMTVTG